MLLAEAAEFGPRANMRFYILICLTMVAFAANSLLNRVAVDYGYIDPESFAVIRVASGALMLIALARFKGANLTWLEPRRGLGALALALYMIGFSTAYLTLPAGLGALILFGVVQISIFVIAAFLKAAPTLRQIVGAVIAFGGLVVIVNPSATVSVDLQGAGLMALAGLGWAVYTINGRYEPDALAGTAANFVLALPLTLAVPFLTDAPHDISAPGLLLAVLSGAFASGLGYALWYSLLPKLTPSTAAILMLSVPVLALAGGVLLLGEVLHLRYLGGAVLVLGGLTLSFLKPRT